MNKKIMYAVCVLSWMMICCLRCQQAWAKGRPQWLQTGEESLNKKRSNEGYRFKIFNTYGMNEGRLRAERFQPLLTHVCEQYHIDPNEIRLDSIRTGSDSLTTYCITFPEVGGVGLVYARRIDDYSVYEDYVDNTFQFEYCQLYAVSEKNVSPAVFDDFRLTCIYNDFALVLSVVPGLGQIYKGQPRKGYVILGTEAALLAGTIVFSVKKNDADRRMKEYPDFKDSWKSKSRGWAQMRNVCIGLASGLYIYNLIDAKVAKGSRQVVVDKSRGRRLSVLPMASPEGTELSFVFQF